MPGRSILDGERSTSIARSGLGYAAPSMDFRIMASAAATSFSGAK